MWVLVLFSYGEVMTQIYATIHLAGKKNLKTLFYGIEVG